MTMNVCLHAGPGVYNASAAESVQGMAGRTVAAALSETPYPSGVDCGA
jgi:hypothetical protein